MEEIPKNSSNADDMSKEFDSNADADAVILESWKVDFFLRLRYLMGDSPNNLGLLNTPDDYDKIGMAINYSNQPALINCIYSVSGLNATDIEDLMQWTEGFLYPNVDRMMQATNFYIQNIQKQRQRNASMEQ